MRTVQLDKERPIKIRFGVLEDFQDLTGVKALEFNARDAKQLSVMTWLALKCGDPNIDIDEASFKDHMHYGVADAVVEEFMVASMGEAKANEILKDAGKLKEVGE